MTRPTGVTILGILGIIGGGLFVFLAMLLLLGSAFVAHRALGMPGFLVGMGAAALGVFVGGLGSLYLIAGVGLLSLKDWARILTMVLAGIGLAFSALAVLGGLTHFFIALAFRRLIIGAIDVLILWYLSQAEIKRAFQPTAPPAPVAPAL